MENSAPGRLIRFGCKVGVCKSGRTTLEYSARALPMATVGQTHSTNRENTMSYLSVLWRRDQEQEEMLAVVRAC